MNDIFMSIEKSCGGKTFIYFLISSRDKELRKSEMELYLTV